MKAELEFVCIDGNVAKRNVAGYCMSKKGFLTKGLSNTHRCVERKCEQYIPILSFLQELLTEIEPGIFVSEIKNGK